MSNISNNESGLSVRTKLNNALADLGRVPVSDLSGKTHYILKVNYTGDGLDLVPIEDLQESYNLVKNPSFLRWGAGDMPDDWIYDGTGSASVNIQKAQTDGYQNKTSLDLKSIVNDFTSRSVRSSIFRITPSDRLNVSFKSSTLFESGSGDPSGVVKSRIKVEFATTSGGFSSSTVQYSDNMGYAESDSLYTFKESFIPPAGSNFARVSIQSKRSGTDNLRVRLNSVEVRTETHIIPRNVEELTDTDLTGLANGDILIYNTSTEKWESGELPQQITLDTVLDANSQNPLTNEAITNALFSSVSPPNYSGPSLNLTGFSPSTFEPGDTISRNLSITFNENDAGSSTAYRLERDGVPVGLSGTSYTVNEVANALGSVTYRAEVDYGETPSSKYKTNSLGLEDTRGVIPAGTKGQNRVYNIKLKQFFGSVASEPANFRTLPDNNFDNNNTLVFTATEVIIVFVIPAGKTLVSVWTDAPEEITSDFGSGEAILVEDAAGNTHSYTKYSASSALPYDREITVTLQG